MKNIIILLLFSLTIISGMSSCKGNDDFLYESQDNIYFNFADSASSKISFTFAYTPTITQDTIFVPVKISGKKSPYDRTFKIEVIDSLTTAQSNIHYKPFTDKYIMPADSGMINVPIIIYNTDPILNDSTVILSFSLKSTDDFQINFPDKITGSISFSNRLEQPSWWIYWMGELGPYSRVKHQLFLISSGTTTLPDMSKSDAYLLTPEALFHLSVYKSFLADPFTWVSKNTDYVLSKKANGNYDFYLKDSPEKVIPLVWDQSSNTYHFIDEKGQLIS